MRRHILTIILTTVWMTGFAAIGDTFYANVSQPNGSTRMMFTILTTSSPYKAALGNGYSACLNYQYSGKINIPATVSYGGRTYTVTQINKFAFYLCNLITEVSLPSSLDKIDEWAFYGCRKLSVSNKTTKNAPAVKALGAGAFALTDLRTFWVDDASKCDKDLFRGCDNMRWVVFDGKETNSANTFSRRYDRSASRYGAENFTYGLPKATVVYMPAGVAWPTAYDASRTSLTPTSDDWAKANYVYVDAATGERKSQFVAFGYKVSQLGISCDEKTSHDLPLEFTASLAYISRNATAFPSTQRVQTIYVPMDIPMSRYNTTSAYKSSKAYQFEKYENGVFTFHKVATLAAGKPGLLMDYFNEVLTNTNAKILAFGPTTVSQSTANTMLSTANQQTDGCSGKKPNGVMIGYYDHQTVPIGCYAYAGSGNTLSSDNKTAIEAGTFFHVTKSTNSAPMRAVLWIGTSSTSKEQIAAEFEDDDDASTTTLIQGIADRKHVPAAGWYTLGGVRLDGEPTQNGIYIHNGRKVIMR